MDIKNQMLNKLLNILEGLTEYLLKVTNRVSDPFYHRFFAEIERHRRWVVPRQNFYRKNEYDTKRTEMYRNMLQVKFDVREKKMKEYIKYVKRENKPCRDKAFEIITEITNEYEREWQLQWVPDIVIQKFNKWHNPHTELLMKGIDNILLSEAFKTNNEKLNAILFTNLTILYLTYSDIENTLGDVNGDIDENLYSNT